jgi:hypothetical protein
VRLESYNHYVTRGPLILAIATALAVVGCSRAPENKEAVRDAVTEHLAKNAALDMNQLTVDIGDVKFQGNEATASVAIKPKSAPDQGMTMSYTLERRGDKWQVKGRGAGHGGGTGMGGGMPGGMGSQSGTEIPSGHPPVNSPGGGAKSGDLPAGHPPVNTPPPASK